MKTLVFFLDALMDKQITKECMPFLYDFKNKNTNLSMIPDIGYSMGAHATIWSGLNQDKHGKFLIFYYSPERSTLKWGKWLKLIPNKFLRAVFIASLKLPYYKIQRLQRNCPKWYKRIIDYPPNLPPEICDKIAIKAVTPTHPNTLFTILNKEKISWHSQTDFNAAYLTKSLPKKIEKFELSDKDVDFFYFYYADGFGHTDGPLGKKTLDYLKQCDEVISRLIKKSGDDVQIFLFSDHGMCEIKNFINIKKKIPIRSLSLSASAVKFGAPPLSVSAQSRI